MIYTFEDDAPYSDGIIAVVVFGVLGILTSIMRNYYDFLSYMLAIRIRKVLVYAIYDKIAKLSIQGISKTDSGGFITLISSGLYSAEASLISLPLLFAAPFINIASYILIGVYVGWKYAGMILAIWVFVFFVEYRISRL